MSNRTYNQLWCQSQSMIQSLLAQESQAHLARPEKEREAAFKNVSKLYLQYVKVSKMLETCLDQIVHPQKRILLRKLLLSTIGRMLELKHDLVSLDNMEYSFHDETMAELTMSPSEVEITIPSFVVGDRIAEIRYWDEQMKLARLKMGDVDTQVEQTEVSPAEAVVLLQNHERARQGRLRAKLMREIRRQEQSEKSKGKEMVHAISHAVAATRLQSVWKGVIARRKAKRMKEQELLFVGMLPPQDFTTDHQDKLALIQADRKSIQLAHESAYQQALIQIKKDIKDEESDEMAEQMKDEIRRWFQDERSETGRFPDYPSDEEGGSGAIFNPPGDGSVVNNAAEDKAAGGAWSKRRERRDSSSDRDDKGDKKGKEEDDDGGYRLSSSEFVRQLRSADKTFQDTWKTKDESNNKEQSYDYDMIRDAKRLEVEDEVRRHVDVYMRDELDLIKMAVERDKGKKGKIMKKRKRSKKKASKKGKKKKEKDLTPDRSTESLFEELVLNGIIKSYPEVRLSQFLGDISYTASCMKSTSVKEPVPGGGDVRRLVAEYCILPLSSQYLRENTPHVKSLLLAGPAGSGKTMLVNVVCSELRATLFDLTATNIVGKYPGKSGLNMLLHLVMKVARLLQPSIIFIDQADKTFLKKVSKTDKSDPKRLKKDLPRLVRSLSSEDRIMLIGASRCPWECEQKGLCLTYQKMVVLPIPGYAQRYTLWKELILQRGITTVRRPDLFDLSSLAKVSENYTSGHIAMAVQATLTQRRVLQHKMRPIRPVEFMAALAKCEPIYREEEEAFAAWYCKTPIGKKRHKSIEGDDDEGKKEKKTAKASKKKK